ncbi:MAG: DUF4293 domain-containing protein [Flavobacteriales bacterium]|nr:DUF4293 domain-containing protein [Flavobacteriales bacterium]
MLQRSQTIYLILAVIVMALTLFFPFAIYPVGETEVNFNLYGVSQNEAKASVWFPYYIVISLMIALSIFSITQYKNRKRQLNLGKINYLLILIIVVMLFVDASSVATKLGIEETAIRYQVGMYLPVAAFAFTFLANRGIKKDEELVKSVERLR